MADLGFVGQEAYAMLGALFKKNNTKLGTKSEYLFRVPPRSWKGSVQMWGPEAKASLASR